MRTPSVRHRLLSIYWHLIISTDLPFRLVGDAYVQVGAEETAERFNFDVERRGHEEDL